MQVSLNIVGIRRFLKKHIKSSYKNILLIVSLVLATIVLIILSVTSYSKTINFIIEKCESANKSMLTQITRKVESNFSEVKNITRFFTGNTLLQKYLIDYENSREQPYDRLLIQNNILLLLQKMKNNNDQIAAIAVFSKSTVFSTDTGLIYKGDNGSILSSNIGNNLRKDKSDVIFLEPDRFAEDKGERMNNPMDVINYSFCFCGLIEKNNSIYGSVFVVLKKDWCENLLKKNPNLLVLNKNGGVLWKGNGLKEEDIKMLSNNNTNSGGNTLLRINGKKYRIFRDKVVFTNLDIIYVESLDLIYSELNIVKKLVAIDLLISILASLIISSFISGRIIRPIIIVKETVDKYKNKADSFELFKYSKSFKNKVFLQKNIMYYLIMVIIVPAFIYSLVYQVYSSKIIDEQILNSYQVSFNQTLENIDIYLGTKVKILKNIIYNDDIQNALFIRTKSSTEVDEIMKIKPTVIKNNSELNNIIKTYLLMGNNRDEVCLYKSDKSLLVSNINDNDNISFPNDFTGILNKESKRPLWISTPKDIYNRNMINLVREIRYVNSSVSSKENMEIIGFIEILIDESSLRSIYRDIVDNTSNIYLSDIDNKVISSSKNEMIGNRVVSDFSNRAILTINKNKFIGLISTVETTGWKVVGLFDYNTAFKEKSRMFYENMYILVIMLFIIIFISFQLSFSLLSPINKMNSILNKLNIMSMEAVFPEEHYINEIEELGKAFNDMVLRIEALIDEILITKIKTKEIEAQKKEAELLALQAQISPHFLNNTLSFIMLEINEGRNNSANLMINALIDLFRFGISREDVIITIEQEIKYAKAYAEIMILRYHEKMEFKWEIDENILNYKTIKLILQPIIENSIHHGIKNKKVPGKIKVSCTETVKELLLIVEDDGLGIDSSTLEELNFELQKNEVTNRVGIFNVHKRIKLYFGEDYGLHLYSKINQGTIVEINLPKIVG